MERTLHVATNALDLPKISHPLAANRLFFGDNLNVLRQHIADNSVALCYIDPPFNSKRNYNQIYDKVGTEDRAQAQAFVDTWMWDTIAEQGLGEILDNEKSRFTPQIIDLIQGFQNILHKGSLLAYLVSMTLRITEIHRVLKPTGSLYLHCDPTASHYLKVLLDAIFGPQNFKNEIVWKRAHAHSDSKQGAQHFGRVTDTILFYGNGLNAAWNTQYTAYNDEYVKRDYRRVDADGRRYRIDNLQGPGGAAKGNPYYEAMGVKEYWRYSSEKME